MVEVEIWKTNTLKVHDTLEYEFENLLREFVYDEEAGGEESKVRTLIWAQGVAMWITNIINPTSDIVNDEVNGTLHFQRVTYAIKERFEKRVVRGNVTVNLLDQSEQPLYHDLAKKLKLNSQEKKQTEEGWKKYYQFRSEIESSVKLATRDEHDLVFAGWKLGLPSQQIIDLLKPDDPPQEAPTKKEM